MLTLDKIYHAAYVLRDVVRKTDLILAPHLNPDCELYLKTENLQTTGSFKVRGAYYKISQLSDEEKSKGVIACSAGNLLFQKWKQQNVMEQMFALSKVYTMTPIKKPVNCSRKAEVPLFIRLMMKM